MILLDTHAWIWWVHGDTRLPMPFQELLAAEERKGLGISVISCWEVAKLVEVGKLILPLPLEDWMNQALAFSEITVLPLTPQIAVSSTRLPQPFHRDPADQIIVATSREMHLPLLTFDSKINDYGHVEKVRLGPK